MALLWTITASTTLQAQAVEPICALEQITNPLGIFFAYPSINADGTRIAFLSSSDLTGGNPEVFLFDATLGLTQITNGVDVERSPILSTDGTRIVFAAKGDPVSGSNLTATRRSSSLTPPWA